MLPPIPQIFHIAVSCMMHGQGVSSLRLGTLEPMPHSPPHQVSAKESKMEKHETKVKEERASSIVPCIRCDHTLGSLDKMITPLFGGPPGKEINSTSVL